MLDVDQLIEFLRTFVPANAIEEVETFVSHLNEHSALPYEANMGEAEVPRTRISGVLDQRHLLNRPARKWYKPNTSLGDKTGKARRTKKRGICFHHTAVAGGFGVHSNVVADLLAQIERTGGGKIELANVLSLPSTVWGKDVANIQALAARYRGAGKKSRYNTGVPYHVLQAQNNVLYLNLPFEFVTWHGGKANNDYIGFGWDALSSVDVPNTEELISGIIETCKIMEAEGHTVEEFVTHSMFTRKPMDPGAQFVEQVMIPAAKITGAKIDMKKKYGKGTALEETLKK